MLHALDGLRELTFVSVLVRLGLAMIFGGFIGLERGRKHRAAGLRTYMVVCMGAALTVMTSLYEYHLLTHDWAELAAEIGIRTDVSRFGAQVINGIGFLGAGTIMVTGRQEVKGLTTAAALWASACMGLAIGAGFYECVILSVLLIAACVQGLRRLEIYMMERARNMNLYVEFDALENVGLVINCLKGQGVQIYEVDIDRGKKDGSRAPSAVFSIRLTSAQHHPQILSALSELDCVYTLDEI